MHDDQNKRSGWHPTVIAALIAAVTAIVTTTITVVVGSRDRGASAEVLRKSPDDEPSAKIDDPPARAVQDRSSQRPINVAELRGYYSAASASGTYHLKINNNGSYVLSAPGGGNAVQGLAIARSGHVELRPESGPASRYTLDEEMSLTSLENAEEQLVFRKVN